MQEKFGAKKIELFLVFVDLEKAFDDVPRELASLLVNHSTLLEERAKFYSLYVRPALLYASCDHRMLRYTSQVRWQDTILNEKVRI